MGKGMRPGAVLGKLAQKGLGLGSRSEATIPIGMFVGARKRS
jgi:hypothetical protein